MMNDIEFGKLKPLENKMMTKYANKTLSEIATELSEPVVQEIMNNEEILSAVLGAKNDAEIADIVMGLLIKNLERDGD